MKYKDGANAAGIHADNGISASWSLARSNTEIMEVAAGTDAAGVIAKLKQDPSVLYAEPDIKIKQHKPLKPKDGSSPSGGPAGAPVTGANGNQKQGASVAPQSEAATEAGMAAAAVPNDPQFMNQWGLHYEGQGIDGETGSPIFGTWDVDIDAPEAWNVTKGTPDTVVAVLDTGVDIEHPDLQDSIWTNAGEIPGNGIDDDHNGFVDDVHGWNFYGGDNSPYSVYDDDFYGTQIAGILAAANDNGIGISGVAPGVKIMPMKVLGPEGGYVSDALMAIDYAERMGAKIANVSWSLEGYSQALKDAIDASSMLFVASAGDDEVNINKDNYPEYPAAYDSDNILSVAGIDMDGKMYGVYGRSSVDIAAPNMKVLTTVPTRDPGVGAEIDNGTYKVIYNELGYEGLFTSSEDPSDPSSVIINRQEGFDKALAYLDKPGGDAKILLVSDEEQTYALPLYQDLLQSAGRSYDIVNVQAGEDGPALEKLSQYDIVIWFTGQAVGSVVNGQLTTVLRGADQSNLTAYLNGGGHLLLAGPGALTNMERSEFVTNMLHLDFIRYDFNRGAIDYSTWRSADGQPGTIYENQSYQISSIFYSDYKSNDESVARMNLSVPMDDYNYEFGTYLASPFASGAAALVMSQDPTLDAEAVKERVILAGKHLESLLDYDSPVYNDNGRMVDAFRAVSDDDAPGKPLQALQTDSLDIMGDHQDVYYVHLNAGDKVNLSLTGDPDTKFVMMLYNPHLNSLNDWDASDKLLATSREDGAPAAISYQAEETGYYYVSVIVTGASGAYTLSKNLESSNPTGTYEDMDAAVGFSGSWTEQADAGYSGGTIKTIDAAGSAKFSFTGSLIELTALKDDTMGIADVYVDGVKVASPSLYSKTPQAKQSIFKQSLKFGYHTIEVAWTGKADPAVKRTVHAINVDSFIVGDGGGAFASIAEESDAAFNFVGMWAWQSNANYSGGHAEVTESAGAYAEFTFTGTNAVLKAATTPSSGKVTVMVDDQPETAKTIDLYSATAQYQVPVFDTGALSYGPHLIRIVNVHAKNEKSSGYGTNVDAVVVTKPSGDDSLKIYQDMNPFVHYTGIWSMHLSTKNAGGSAKYSDAAGNSATLSFLGTKVSLLAQTGANRGMVDVYVDGVKVNADPVDMYSPQFKYKVPVFVSDVLPYGSHDVKIVNAGEKNALSTGYTISIDAFYVVK
ncbi:S8 family serine peptidase [Paenibacillus glycinis]|uniref:S8 family serine peptidase n=1 Tax=Paenibacillus glycinis TaxID=2697035 RepID=A0ABW9XK95_9BACL|nr:S8 family serine peptidase [Paenibacillus glycinis]NBD22946.1 S8 family serine peptidase [Paenibacillus glycinis]